MFFFFWFLLVRSRIRLRLLRRFVRADRHEIGIDQRQHVEDVSEDHVRLQPFRPLCHLRIYLSCNSRVRADIMQKNIESTPRESASDVIELMTRLGQKVVSDRLAIFQSGLRKAYDSPADFPPFFLDASIHALVMAL